MVDIYLDINGAQVCLLSIPKDDIKRLSIKPLKWLRFVTFAVCGAYGNLSETANGPVVDYNIESSNDLADSYYYVSHSKFKFVDSNGANDEIPAYQTPSSNTFRADLIQHYGDSCIVTGEAGDYCDPVYIIPYHKGDKYIQRVIEDRSHLYILGENGLNIRSVNAVENGLFLSKDLHPKCMLGVVAFLKTPNFALDAEDIPRVEKGPNPSNRLTMQNLEPTQGRFSIPDAAVQGDEETEDLFPPAILDYMYGVAAYKRWHGGSDIQSMLQRIHSMPTC